MNDEHAIHNHIAGYQFYKIVTRWSEEGVSIPIPLRKLENVHDAIASIDYIRNAELEKAYKAEISRLQSCGKKVAETLLFHGTAAANVDSILKSNFSLARDCDSSKENRRIFGEGIYFSEMPAVSLMYGNGLLLCKVILGDCEIFRPCTGTTKQPDIPEQFDSRKVLAGDGSGVIHVVKRPSQVLPYCVVNLKNESLSSDFRKPAFMPVSPIIMAQQ